MKDFAKKIPRQVTTFSDDPTFELETNHNLYLRRVKMRGAAIQQTGVMIVLEAGGLNVHCTDMLLEDLIRAGAEAAQVRVASETGRITALMQKLAALLQAVRDAGESDQLEFLYASIQKAWSEIHAVAQLRILAGWSAGGSTLVLAFVKPWTSHCVVEYHADM